MSTAGILVVLALPASAQLTNLAPGGSASQSSIASGGLPERAIDGNTDGTWGNGSVSHTANQPSSWWEVHLGGLQAVHEVRLHNRSDCCPARLSNFRLSLFAGATEVFGQDFYTSGGSVPAGQAEVVPLPAGATGDRVRVELLGLNNEGSGILSLAETEVLQFGPLPVVNLATLGTASQSSLASGGAPERAIDGNTDGWWLNGSVSHTANTAGSWWELDLGAPYGLNEIVLHNRGDCCWERLSNIRVSVHDGADLVFGQDFHTVEGVFPPIPSGSVGPGEALSVPLPAGTSGDRVRVELLGVNTQGDFVLSLAEVEVLRLAPTLTSDTSLLGYTAGGTQAFSLDAGLVAAGLPYLLMGTLSGSSPGFPIDGSNVLPLNPDAYWHYTLSSPNTPPLSGSFGALDKFGRGQASLVVPPGSTNLHGYQAHHAFLVLQPPPALPIVQGVSNGLPLDFVP